MTDWRNKYSIVLLEIGKMNFQLSDILSNPMLLHEVPENILSKWVQEYPYVSLFHLFALKKKENYSEINLHQTAFYFNNREKLYYLLNSKQVKKTENTIENKPINKNIEETEIENTQEEPIKQPIVAPEIVSTQKNIIENEITSLEEPTLRDTTNDVVEKSEIPINIETPTIPEIQVPEKVETTIEDKPLSIADKILLEIEELKAERAKRSADITTPIEKKEEIIETPVDLKDEKIQIPTTTVEAKPAEIIAEQPLSIQDEIIARIQQIQEERTNGKTEEIKPTVVIQEKIENPIAETKEEKEIVFVESKTPIEIGENVPEKPTEVEQKIIETSKIETPNINEEFAIEHAPEFFPEPILVKIEVDKKPEIKKDKFIENNTTTTPITEDIANKTITPISPEIIHIPEPITIEPPKVEKISIPENEIVIPINKQEDKIITKEDAEKNIEKSEQPIPTHEEEYPTAVLEQNNIDTTSTPLFFPTVLEDEIEIHTTPDVISDKAIPSVQSIEDEINVKIISEEVKKEPHTFVEWLKLLDGNLQIQTTEIPKTTENWMEIPQYEVEQTIANKKAIQQEEQKLFEPNFEEGEVDLFTDIDEEVSKVASESVEFKQEMMTETLAKIYAKQGKIDKALDIYNALRLKFPEKSVYFASLIEKIEKEK